MDNPQGQQKAVLAFRKAWKSAPWIPISKMQALSFRERPLEGSTVVSKVQIPRSAEEEAESLRVKVWDAFKSKAEGIEKLDPPAACSCYDGEWIGVDNERKTTRDAQDGMTEQGKYNLIEQNRRNDLTFFYLSGGAWFRAGPPGARPLIKKLCEQTGCRAFTFQYRLVPQYTLLTLVLDVLTAYFYLLSPPPGSFHTPIDPKKLILVGESGGGILHLDILQFIQYIYNSDSNTTLKTNPQMHFFGRDVTPTMPAGCAIICPGADIALSLPSVKKYEKTDWLSERAPWLEPNFPADSIWPSNPPRGDLHCDNSALCHPFVDPSTHTDWRGMPPMWIACGGETYSDGIKFLVRNMRASGVSIRFVEYEFMPHVWNVVIPTLPQSRHVMKLWADACLELGASAVGKRQSEACADEDEGCEG
ncbi:uncharacterized protein BHQ10_004291 [Talaromyces amestolkiae]|uniref:Alpha/beta hydrolase fold-3 domain-containing protein n=1 Tax=Talaromyces amestolkiae TaxID=1196081 RepID=A0A364KXL9_TALAM|nr:uncharacterized protein BHQ10_004291 [Talaromyces amestolkiae]RAO68279.1 hypothetical protein BHQ10_004291 [Talaromyces amestolkiae]